MALYLYIKNNYPEISVKVYLDSPKPVFDHIDRIGEIHTEAEKDVVYDVLFCRLTASSIRPDRAFCRQCFNNAKKTVCIDHHISNTDFADINVVDAECKLLHVRFCTQS